jgi:uncharacterized protein DUF6968
MELKNVGDVIATRELALDGNQKVEILIGKPQRCQDGIDWCCPHQTLGIGSGKVRCAIGVDTIQATIFALSMVGAGLYCSQEYRDGRLSWDCGAVKGDLGFPVPENIRDVLPGGGN